MIEVIEMRVKTSRADNICLGFKIKSNINLIEAQMVWG